jgi:hypothetical protein
MKVESLRESRPAGQREPRDGDDGRPRPVYQPPRIVKKRAVSRATLFTGSGPTSGGVIGEG